MKPFSLQNVLAYRKRLENIAQHRFFEAKKAHRQVEQRLTEENNVLVELSLRSERLQSEGVNITELIRYEERILQVKTNVKAITKTLAEKAEIVSFEHQHLINKANERQIMERLKERQNKAWFAFLNKKETAMLDEIAILHHDSENK
ncbi:MAG: flagellar export protein FliJ [Proteobacteria bacterium]|nr:flagellar export protein FliJ [Pseudomonadota bacterium]